MPFCAPSAIRTRGLLLRSNPAGDGVANSDDAGHVRGGPRCCSPSYLVIGSGGTGRTIATEDAAWIVSREVAPSRLVVGGPSAGTAAARPGTAYRAGGRHAGLPATVRRS